MQNRLISKEKDPVFITKIQKKSHKMLYWLNPEPELDK